MQLAITRTGPRLEPRILGVPEEAFHLFIGLALAPFLALVPFLELWGWFFQALVHETGHALAAWAVGVPAVPTLAITAEAATVHGEQLVPLSLAAWAGLVVLCLRRTRGLSRHAGLAALAVVHPIVAHSSLRESWHLVAGHAAELVVGGLFLARTLPGTRLRDPEHEHLERGLYSVLAWFLILRNLLLAGGLAGSGAARAEYAAGRSLGVENDLVRLAELWGTSLEPLGLGLALAAGAVAPLVVACWTRREARRAARLARFTASSSG
jgi:hypothetical protein